MKTRPLTEGSAYTCDWGYCDEVAVLERFAPEMWHWLPVCALHASTPRDFDEATAQTFDDWRGAQL